MKKILSVLLTVLLLAGLCGSALAEDTIYSEGYFYYTVEDGSITIVGYFGNETEVTIPASIAGVPVNAVAADAFAGTGVLTVYLPDTITAYMDSNVSVVVFDANTDEPYTVDDLLPDSLPEDENQGSISESESDFEVTEHEQQTDESTAPEPEPSAPVGEEKPADPAAPQTQDGEKEAQSPEEPTAEQTPEEGEKEEKESHWANYLLIGVLAAALVLILWHRLGDKKEKK